MTTPILGGTNHTDWTGLFPNQTVVGVKKDISLTNLVGTANAEFSVITQHFSQVPEPSAFLLMGTGLLALGFGRRYVRRRR